MDIKPEVPMLTRWLRVTIVCPAHFAFLKYVSFLSAFFEITVGILQSY